jgi:N-acetylglucosamine kinase-like BadF-type ATPase
MIVAGVDGGQSSTTAVVGDQTRERGRGSGPPADLVGKPRDPALQARAIGIALAAALADAGLPPGTRPDALVAGLTGFDRGISPEPDLGQLAGRFAVVHDTEIAHAGALEGSGGIVVIAGTGSVALGNDRTGDPFVRAGGWGYFFGDEGSAMWIARTALRRAMLRADRGERGELTELALAVYGTTDLRAIQHAFAHGELTRPALAAFASDVLAAAASGDADARDVRTAACRELASLAATVDLRLGPAALRLVSFAGGLFGDGAFVDGFGEALLDALPHGNLTSPVHDPAAGALILARRLAETAAAGGHPR